MAKKELSKVPTEEIVSELQRRQRRLPSLQRKREKVLKQIREVESELAEMDRSNNGAGRRKGTATKARSGRRGRGAPRGIRQGSLPHQMLAYIAEQGPAGATSRDIHAHFGERTSSVSVPLQTLRKRGLVDAEKPAGSGRGYIYTATKAGKAAAKE